LYIILLRLVLLFFVATEKAIELFLTQQKTSDKLFSTT